MTWDGAAVDAPLDRQTLTEQLTRRLTQLITDSRLRSGDSLPSEAELSARFGVSRTITREALRILQERGVVEIANGKRATVRPLTSVPLSNYFGWAVAFEARSRLDLFEVRKGLEPQSAALAAQRRTADDLARIRETLAQMDSQRTDGRVYTDLDYRLHLQIAMASHNEMLLHLIGAIQVQFKGTVREDLLHRVGYDTITTMQQGLERLVAAIESGKVAAAFALMSEHIDFAAGSTPAEHYLDGTAIPSRV